MSKASSIGTLRKVLNSAILNGATEDTPVFLAKDDDAKVSVGWADWDLCMKKYTVVVDGGRCVVADAVDPEVELDAKCAKISGVCLILFPTW